MTSVCGFLRTLDDRALTRLRGAVFGFIFQFFNLMTTLTGTIHSTFDRLHDSIYGRTDVVISGEQSVGSLRGRTRCPRASYSIAHLNEQTIACMLAPMPVVPTDLLEDVAHLFGLLSDPTRLRLLSRLHDDGELSVGELAERTGVAVANVSQHLNRLALAKVVARRRDGKHVRYRISDPRLEALCDLVCSSVRERGELLAG